MFINLILVFKNISKNLLLLLLTPLLVLFIYWPIFFKYFMILIIKFKDEEKSIELIFLENQRDRRYLNDMIFPAVLFPSAGR